MCKVDVKVEVLLSWARIGATAHEAFCDVGISWPFGFIRPFQVARDVAFLGQRNVRHGSEWRWVTRGGVARGLPPVRPPVPIPIPKPGAKLFDDSDDESFNRGGTLSPFSRE